MRKFSLAVHLWLGLIAALFLFVEGVTGGLMAWGPEIIGLLNSSPRQSQPTYRASSSGPSLPLARLVPKLQQAENGLYLRIIHFAPTAKDAGVAEFDASDGTRARVWFDPSSGEILGTQTMRLRHAWLLQLTRWAGRYHGDFPAAVALLLIATTGLILWWPRQLFALQGPFSLERVNFQVHATVGFYASLLLFVFASTAVIMGEQRLALRVANWITHTPEPPPTVQQTHPAEHRSAPLALDEAFALARRDRPIGSFTAVQWVTDDGLVAFQYRTAELTGRLLVDLRSGRIRELLDRRVLTGPERFIRVWVRQVHEGEIYGSISRWIAGACGFLLAVLAITGPLTWYLRRRQPPPTSAPGQTIQPTYPRT